MKRVGFLYDEAFLKHKTPYGHPENGARLVSVMDRLRASGIWGSLLHINPRSATPDELRYVHTPEYVARMTKFTGFADPDTYVSDDSFEAASMAAGAVLVAVEKCRAGEVDRAFCAVRPPGHHAEADRAKGFCIFNNVAVGARHAQRLGYKKVFIVDFDVHHGNGTQHIFEEDNTVFYFSTHQYPHYPGTGSENETGTGRGRGYTLNIPVRSGAGLKEYSAIYQDMLPGVVRRFAPDIILVSAGYDLHSGDPLSGTRVSDEGVRAIVRSIAGIMDVPYVFALEGGYDLVDLSNSVLITLDELLGG